MEGVRQRKTMGMGNDIMAQDSNFGVAPFHEVNGGSEHPDRGMAHKPMKDGARGVGRNIERGAGMGAQAQPDHGPHQHTDFGVGSIPR